ncbi:hypothetical protein L1887_14593 [Cichorium endivia]|nr:hypothetical protein L1887_14593 [Cichorium endivia]
METPQELETFLPFGEVAYAFRLGFLKYWHRHGLCCFNFVQHSCDGGAGDVRAGRHGFSSDTEHVTAVATCDPPSTITIMATAYTTMHVGDFIFQYFQDFNDLKTGRLLWRI